MKRVLALCASVCLLSIGPAHSAQIAQVQNYINFEGISGDDGLVSSTLNCTAGVCSIYNELQFWGGDAVVKLVWTRDDGSVLLSGQVPWDFTLGEPNTTIGRRSGVAYVGWLYGTPSYYQSTGTADYRYSRGINPPCIVDSLGSKVCDQDYLEFDPGWLSAQIYNPLPNSSPRDDVLGNGRLTTAAGGGPISTIWTLSDLNVPVGSPFGTPPTVVDLLQLTSTVEELDSGYRYSYALNSQSGDETEFTFDALGWTGTVDPMGTATLEFDSVLGPRVVRTSGTSDFGDGKTFLATLDVLQPVPEPRTWMMLGVGLVCIALGTLRRTRKR